MQQPREPTAGLASPSSTFCLRGGKANACRPTDDFALALAFGIGRGCGCGALHGFGFGFGLPRA